jgi:PPOX class probable FMN-dependent enzyme
VAKQIDHLDGHCRALIAHSPFLVMATAGADGRCDSSPRGGPAGFVRVLDDHRLAIPDLAGNNRLDSLENILEHPGVGLLFFVPGLDETLRVNGAAQLSNDVAVLDVCTINDVRPRLVVAVRVEAAYIHCAKALRRSGLWQPELWPDTSGLPTIACVLRDHYALPDLDLAAVEERLAQSYQLTMWLAGGEAPPITGD